MGLRLNGWMRLGIAISVLWVIVAGTYAGHDIRQVSEREERWENAPVVGGEVPKHESPMRLIITNYSFLTQCSYLDAPGLTTTCELRSVNLFLLVVVPVIALWIAGFSVAWIRAGFNAPARSE